MARRLTKPRSPLFVGVIHLLPLPGAPQTSPGLEAVEARAVRDANALVRGGVDGVVLENFGDAPFFADRVDSWTVAAMTRIGSAVRRAAPRTFLGINVLRNDARAALSIATAVGAQFVRVNVHTGTMVTDQGIITGDARNTLLERRRLDPSIAIAADILVKHAAPLGALSLEQAARDTWYRGRADVLIVTGSGTGHPLDPSDLDRARRAVPEALLWAGSGVNESNLAHLHGRIDGAIVGTALHEDGHLGAPIDERRVKALGDALRR